jgi:hypothetical protein
VPGGFVDYPARRVAGCRIVYFDFALAREMGLIPAGHPDRLTGPLARAVLDTFAITVVNEFEMRSRRRRRGLLGPYMATRYLQLEHPGRRGETSGDGRSVWLGAVSNGERTWDVSACGTGVTRLCPATAWTGRFYKTGSRTASYGCGTAAVEEGLAAALMSETLRRGGMATERVLAVLRRPDGYAINVRAYPSLLRPAHFLVWLKQGDLEALRGVAEAYWERQVGNGAFPPLQGDRRWTFLAEHVARSFARAAATFEAEYVFCWMDWDGDNILMDGAILDYGSVRQFGLYHREYRYDDGPRWSTTIPEQRRKARHIVQCFAQIRDFLISGRKRPLKAFHRDPVVTLFDAAFDAARSESYLRHAGFPPRVAGALLSLRRGLVERYAREHRYFEHCRSRRGPVRVSDGITWNAVYSIRDLLRELPRRLLAGERTLGPREFLALAASSYASRRDRTATAARTRHVHAFQKAYLELVEAGAALTGASTRATLRRLSSRAEALHGFARITGDACIEVSSALARGRRRAEDNYAIVEALASGYAPGAAPGAPAVSGPAADALPALRRRIEERRHGI